MPKHTLKDYVSGSVRGVQLFVNAHRTWFTLVGAFVVLATFLVNERIRDTNKDWADTSERQATEAEVDFRLDRIEDNILIGHQDAIDIATRADPKAVSQEMRWRAVLMKNSLIKTINAHNDEITNRFGIPAKRRVRDEGDLLGQFEETLGVLSREVSFYQKLDEQKLNEANRIASALCGIALQNEEALVVLPRSNSEISDASYHNVENISDVFYAIGWCLNLLGALLGVKLGSEES